MEYETLTVDQFRQVKNHRGGYVKTSPERIAITEMEPNTAISFELSTLTCERPQKTCPLASITQELRIRHTDRRWALRHEIGTTMHYVACFAISDNSTS